MQAWGPWDTWSWEALEIRPERLGICLPCPDTPVAPSEIGVILPTVPE